MSIDFNKKYSLQETIDIVHELYERFNENNNNMIDLNKVKEAINSIETNYDNFPDTVKEKFEDGAMGQFFEDKIYIKDDFKIDVLFHEILHFITRDHGGLKLPLCDTYTDADLKVYFEKYGRDKFADFIEQLDESMTRFITELAIPEIKISDSYKYGAKLIRTYYNGLIAKGKNPEFLFNMYLNGDMDDILKFKNSYGRNFEDVMASIERINNVSHYVRKRPKTNVIEYDAALEATYEAIDKVNVRH